MESINYVKYAVEWCDDSLNNLGSFLNDLYSESSRDENKFDDNKLLFVYNYRAYNNCLNFIKNYMRSYKFKKNKPVLSLLYNDLKKKFQQNNPMYKCEGEFLDFDFDEVIKYYSYVNECFNKVSRNLKVKDIVQAYLVNKLIEHNIGEIYDYFILGEESLI